MAQAFRRVGLGRGDAPGGAEPPGPGVRLDRRPAGARQASALHRGAAPHQPAAVVGAGPGAVGLADRGDPAVAAGEHVEPEEATESRAVVAGLLGVVALVVVDALVGLRVGADRGVLRSAGAPGQRRRRQRGDPEQDGLRAHPSRAGAHRPPVRDGPNHRFSSRATPSSTTVSVTSSAASWTSSGAWPIATPRPAQRSISMSLRPSPMARTSSAPTPSPWAPPASAEAFETPSGEMSSHAVQPMK